MTRRDIRGYPQWENTVHIENGVHKGSCHAWTIRKIARWWTLAAVSVAVVAAVSGPLTQRVGTRLLVAAGLAMMSAALLGTATVGGDGRVADLMPWLLAYGVGAGLLVPLTAAITGRLPAHRTGVASGVLNVSREVFGLLGITVLGAVVSTRRAVDLGRGVAPIHAFLSGYQLALVVAAVIVAVGVPVSLHALRTRPTQPARPVLTTARPAHQR